MNDGELCEALRLLKEAGWGEAMVPDTPCPCLRMECPPARPRTWGMRKTDRYAALENIDEMLSEIQKMLGIEI